MPILRALALAAFVACAVPPASAASHETHEPWSGSAGLPPLVQLMLHADDPYTQYLIGVAYLNGDGAPRNDELALFWEHRAARHQSPEGQWALGYMFWHGIGVEQNSTAARYWNRQAAYLGSAGAQVDLGFMLEFGIGGAADLDEALAWYRVAADRGDPYGQYWLGDAYRYGRGLRTDPAEAESWITLAAEQDLPEAEIALGDMLMVHSQANGPRAMALYRKAAKAGLADGMLALGNAYWNGVAVHRNLMLAAAWYHRGAAAGSDWARYYLALSHFDDRLPRRTPMGGKRWLVQAAQALPTAQLVLGRVIEQSHFARHYEIASYWYGRAAEQGDADAQHDLGMLHVAGRGRPVDLARGVALLQQAVAQGNAAAQYDLAGLYYTGEGVAFDYREAVRLYRLAAGQGFRQAQIKLGGLYATGFDDPPDWAEAMRWYDMAGKDGSPEYQLWLADTYRRLHLDGASENAAKWTRIAAERNYAPAQAQLGHWYATGDGVSQDNFEAYKWLSLAARNGNIAAGIELYMVLFRLTPRQIAALKAVVADWRPTPG